MSNTIGSYETIKTLGTGAFGTVKLVKSKKSGNLYAIKIIFKQNVTRAQMGAQLQKEISIMKSLKHPNIVQIHQCLSSADYIYIVMDFAPGGELFTKITRGGTLSNNECRRYVRQLCSALKYCHSLNVCHRDIKPQNILLDENDNALLADFGFASIMSWDEEVDHSSGKFNRDDGVPTAMEFTNNITHEDISMEAPSRLMKKMSTICGTMGYMAPEIYNRDKYYGDKADVWSLGVVIYVLLVGFMPFRETDTVKDVFKVPKHVGNDATDFMSKMLILEPENRWSARRLLEHPWLTGDEEIEEEERTARQDSYADDEEEEEDDERTRDFTRPIPRNIKKGSLLRDISRCLNDDSDTKWRVVEENDVIKVATYTSTGPKFFSITFSNGSLHVNNHTIDSNRTAMRKLESAIDKCIRNLD